MERGDASFHVPVSLRRPLPDYQGGSKDGRGDCTLPKLFSVHHSYLQPGGLSRTSSPSSPEEDRTTKRHNHFDYSGISAKKICHPWWNLKNTFKKVGLDLKKMRNKFSSQYPFEWMSVCTLMCALGYETQDLAQ